MREIKKIDELNTFKRDLERTITEEVKEFHNKYGDCEISINPRYLREAEGGPILVSISVYLEI